MTNIQKNLQKIQKSIPQDVALVAVSKTKSISEILEAYNAGQRIFGENKIQEMTEKWNAMPKDIKWHMIGHVQTNKVKYIAPFVDLIHAVDSMKLLKEINKQGQKHDRIINCLLQLKIAKEESKFGLHKQDAQALLFSEEIKKMSHVNIQGLMGMATFTNDQEQIKNEFEIIHEFFNELKSKCPEFKTLSTGMSGDYKIAIDSGSTMVRVGSSIFGTRNKH